RCRGAILYLLALIHLGGVALEATQVFVVGSGVCHVFRSIGSLGSNCAKGRLFHTIYPVLGNDRRSDPRLWRYARFHSAAAGGATCIGCGRDVDSLVCCVHRWRRELSRLASGGASSRLCASHCSRSGRDAESMGTVECPYGRNRDDQLLAL